jgi:hypothetical protein
MLVFDGFHHMVAEEKRGGDHTSGRREDEEEEEEEDVQCFCFRWIGRQWIGPTSG